MTSTAQTGVAHRAAPGRPRAEGLDDKIIQATLRLIDQGRPVTVSAIVAGSGVSRAALYRRWPSLTDLLADALDHGRAAPDIDTSDDIRGTLLGLLFERRTEARGATYTDRRFRKRLELVMADRDLQHAYWQSHVRRRRQGMVEALQAGIERGELNPDLNVDASLDALLGVFYYQAVARGVSVDEPETEQRCRRAFDVIWRGMGV